MSEEPKPDEKPVERRIYYAIARAAKQRERFYNLVMKAIDELPPEFHDRLENVDVVVEDWPNQAQLARNNVRNRFSLLGLYEGVPHLKRGLGYGMVLPDKITIFQKPIEDKCREDATEVTREVQRVVMHEIAHHFGIGDERLDELEGLED